MICPRDIVKMVLYKMLGERSAVKNFKPENNII